MVRSDGNRYWELVLSNAILNNNVIVNIRLDNRYLADINDLPPGSIIRGYADQMIIGIALAFNAGYHNVMPEPQITLIVRDNMENRVLDIPMNIREALNLQCRLPQHTGDMNDIIFPDMLHMVIRISREELRNAIAGRSSTFRGIVVDAVDVNLPERNIGFFGSMGCNIL